MTVPAHRQPDILDAATFVGVACLVAFAIRRLLYLFL
jgi:hypothetical protein